MFTALMSAVALLDEPTPVSIDEVRADLERFVGFHLKICGEISPDRTRINSDTMQRIHGRVGVMVRYAKTFGRDKCVTGYLVRDASQKPADAKGVREMAIIDSAVQPVYVFLIDRDD